MDNSKGPDVTIPNGTAVSNVIKAREVYSDAVGIMLYGPASLEADTFKIEVSPDPDAGTPVWNDLQDDSATNVAPPGADKARAYYILALAGGFRITDASGNVGADRTWKMTKIFKMN